MGLYMVLYGYYVWVIYGLYNIYGSYMGYILYMGLNMVYIWMGYIWIINGSAHLLMKKFNDLFTEDSPISLLLFSHINQSGTKNLRLTFLKCGLPSYYNFSQLSRLEWGGIIIL